MKIFKTKYLESDRPTSELYEKYQPIVNTIPYIKIIRISLFH